jgi:hypothetical protein
MVQWDLKVDTVCFPETLVSTYKSTWRHHPEQLHGTVSSLIVWDSFIWSNNYLRRYSGLSDIGNFHVGKDVDCGLLGYDAA